MTSSGRQGASAKERLHYNPVEGAAELFSPEFIAYLVHLAEKKRQGAKLGRPAFGETPEEKLVITRIKRLRGRGESYTAIAARLSTDGVPTKLGGKWSRTAVKRTMERTNATS